MLGEDQLSSVYTSFQQYAGAVGAHEIAQDDDPDRIDDVILSVNT